MSSSDHLFSEDEVLSITSSERSSPIHVNISPMSHGSGNSLVKTTYINQKKLPLKQNKSPINSSWVAMNFFNSLSLNMKENINAKNAQRDRLSITNTAAANVGAKSSISKGKSPSSPPFSSQIHKRNSLPTMTQTNTGAYTNTDATQREFLPTTATCTNAAASTNTDTESRGAKPCEAMGNFPSLPHTDSSEKNLSSSTKIGLYASSPPSYTHTQINKATETNLESCSKSPALANSKTQLNKANDIDSGEIAPPLIQINESKQEERPSTTVNAFWSIFNHKPVASKLSLSKKPTNLSINTGKRSISPHQRSASLRPDAQGDLKLKLKPNNRSMPTVGNLATARTLSRPAAKRDLFKSPSKSPDEQPMSFSEVVAGTGPIFVAPSVPAPTTKTPAKRTNDDLDCSSFKTPNKRLCVTTNFKSPSIFPPLTTPVFQSKAAKSVYEESKTRNRLSHQPLPCSTNAPARSATTAPPQNTDAELPPWKLVPLSCRAPPILVDDVKEIVPLLEKLNYTAGVSSYTTRATEGNGVRIQAKDMTAYHKIKDVLIANGFPLFTNQPKSERGFRVVIRHLHHSTPCSWIVKELLTLGFTARFVRNMTNPATGGPMRMFEVEIVMAKDGSHDKIISLKQIGGQRVDIERKNRTREPVQCYRCQGFRHAKNSCMRPPRCMKCAGDHLSSCCTKPRTTPATCVNCSGEHISAYKGCPVYKAEKQKLAANNIDTNKIRTIKDATNNFYRRQGPPPRNNTPRLPHSSAILNRSIAEARQEAARKSMLNPFRQNMNDKRPRFSSHDSAIQMRLNKWRRNTNNIPKKGRTTSKNNAKPRLVSKTSNPAQRHLENYQDMLRKQRSEENYQEPEKGTSNPMQVNNDSPPTTSRAARASFKPRFIDEAMQSPRNSNPNSQKDFLDGPTTILANRVDNLEKKIDILMALITQGINNKLDMDTSN